MLTVKKRHYIIITAALVSLLILENTQSLGLEGNVSLYILYALKIALWSALGVFIMLLPSARFAGLIRLRGMIVKLAGIFALLHIVCFMAVGFFTEFGENIYSLSPAGIAYNIIPLAAALAGGEMCRAYLISSFSGRNPQRAVICIGIIFSLFNIPLSKAASIEDYLGVLDFITSTVFQQLAFSMVASCLAYLAGPLPAILYLGIIRAFGYLSPYIPSPELIPKMLFNVFIPLISIFIIMKLYSREASEYDRRNRQKGGITPGWIATSVFSVIIVWFAVGVFPIFPSVILTGSMEPMIMPGDIVLFEKVGADSVEVGEIIMYNNGNGMNITHRVIEKSNETGEILFTTKGDNNNCTDAGPINATQLKGRVIAIIPDLGNITLFFRGKLGA